MTTIYLIHYYVIVKLKEGMEYKGLLRRPAEVLGQVHVATRMRPVDALWALAYGGPLSLLPLAISNLREDTLEPKQGNFSVAIATTCLAGPIFRIISTAIKYPKNNEALSLVVR